jgi:hypothetical protein
LRLHGTILTAGSPNENPISRNSQAGLAAAAPHLDPALASRPPGHRGVRELLLDQFPPLEIAALSRNRPSLIVNAALAAIQHCARERWPRHAYAT